MTVGTQSIELVPDGMTGGIVEPNLKLLRIVGSITLEPQAAATASSLVAFAIGRTVHAADGTFPSIDPSATDIDSGANDILWQKQLVPSYGAQLTATALDLSMQIDIDLRSRGTLRLLKRRNGLFLFHNADVSVRVEFTMRLRILLGIP